MARLSDPFQEELNGLPLSDPPPLGLASTDGRDTLAASAEVPVFATADVTDGQDTGGRFGVPYVYIGEYEEVVVPTGIYQAIVRLVGAAGAGFNSTESARGRGAIVEAAISVVPGETLRLYVGGKGDWGANQTDGGFNGGGGVGIQQAAAGGGATDIRRSPYALADRLLVAGGAGGGARITNSSLSPTTEEVPGSAGGWPNGQGLREGMRPDVDTPQNFYVEDYEWPAGGFGGTQTAGGLGGKAIGAETDASPGTFGRGGDGEDWWQPGGGGGWYGGGGGGSYNGSAVTVGPAGGGSSYIPESLPYSFALDGGGPQSHGSAAITWLPTPVGNRLEQSDGRDTAAGTGTVGGKTIGVIATTTDNVAEATASTSVSLTGPDMIEGDLLVVAVTNDATTAITAPGGLGFVEITNLATEASGNQHTTYVFAAKETAGGALDGTTLTFSRTGSGRITAVMTVLRAANGNIDITPSNIATSAPLRTSLNSIGYHEIPSRSTVPAGSVTVGVVRCDADWSGGGKTKFWNTTQDRTKVAAGELYEDGYSVSGGLQLEDERVLQILTHVDGDGSALSASGTMCVGTAVSDLHQNVTMSITFSPGVQVDATDGRDTAAGVGFIDVPAEGTLAESDGIDTAVGAAQFAPEATLAETDGIDTAVGVGFGPRSSSALALSDGIDTAAGSGDVPNNGALAATDGIDTAVGAGSITFQASLAATDGIDTAAGSGSLLFEATLAATDSIDTAAGAGLGALYEGTLAESDGIDTAVGDGTIPNLGGLVETDGIDTAVGAAWLLDKIGLLTANVTLFDTRVGVSVLPSTISTVYGTSTHTVIAGTTSRTAGAAAVLDGDYAFRGLYGFDTTTSSPGDFQTDARDWVQLAEWGDFQFQIRRDIATTYRIRADFVNAATDASFATGSITIPSGVPTSLGLGVTRDVTTGVIKMWVSTDGWLTWTQIPTATSTFAAGALPDSVPDPIVLLGGDLQDGPWISVFQAHWGSTDDITAVDANEVAAWNYGANIVTGVGGDFYDAIDRDTKNLWEFGSETSYVYSQRSETTDAGTTVRADFTFNAPTLNTGTAPAGTEAGFVYDLTPQWGQGPAQSQWSPRIGFSSSSQLTVNRPNLSAVARQDDGTGERYRVIVVERDGTPIIACDNAKTGPITWSLNEAESFGFQLPGVDECNEYIGVTDTEVQVWRGDLMLVWGVVVRSLRNGDTVDYQCRGLAWYFTKRFVGGPRQNFLGNGSFETNGWWWENKFQPTENPLFGLDFSGNNWQGGVSTERSIAGFPGKSLRLYSNDVIEFGVTWFQFIFAEVNNAEWPDGITWTASAWVYIPSDEWGEYDAEAEKIVGERNAAYNWGGESAPFGLHLVRMSTTESQEQDIVDESYPKVEEVSVAGLTEDTPRDQWVRIETSLVAPAAGDGATSRTDWMQVELHCPIGTVFWDEVSLTRNDRLFYNEVAQEAILFDIIQHAQDPEFGKTDLNIGFAAAPITNINRTREYPFFNRRLISDIIDEFSTIWDGVDWSIETTPTQRLFAPWFPMKGTRRPAQALVGGRNIASLSIANDGEQLANRFVVMSDGGGTGSSREEAIGTRGTPDVVLEASINAVPESPLDSLEGQLQRALRFGQDATIPTLTTYEGVGSQLLGQVTTGDVVPVSVVYGSLALQGDYRIVALTWNPDDETMDFVLNQFDDYRDPSL